MRKRSWILPIVALACVAVVVTGWVVRRDRDQPVPYRTASVDRGDIRVQVSATGTLAAVTTVQVGSQVSGSIAALSADYNDHVKKGQLLAQLDPTFLKAQVAQSAADLQKTQVHLTQAQRDYDRQKPLRDQGLASQAEVDQTETALAAAKADVQSSQAALDRAQTNLKYTTILSPIDGVVVSRNVDVGQTVAASLSAPTIFTIANDLTQMQLDASVDEADIGQVKVDQKVNFTVDAFPDMTFHGTVKQIRLAPQTVQNVVSYDVIVLVSNAELKLLPGMTANATFLIDEADGVLRVPAAALRFRPAQFAGGRGGAGGVPQGSALQDQGQVPGPGHGGTRQGQGHHGALVWILDPRGSIHMMRVQPGLSDGTYTAVSADSLREGMNVVIGMNQGAGVAAQQQTVNPFMPGGGRGAPRGR